MKSEDCEFYLLGYWQNPYVARDKEYFWSGPFETRKEALERGKLKQKRGQPKRFVNWLVGKNSVYSNREGFLTATKKVGFTPALPT